MSAPRAVKDLLDCVRPSAAERAELDGIIFGELTRGIFNQVARLDKAAALLNAAVNGSEVSHV